MKLKLLREKMNLSQKELSIKAGVSVRTLQDYEQGHRSISKANGITLYNLAKALNCHMEELVEDEILLEKQEEKNIK